MKHAAQNHALSQHSRRSWIFLVLGPVAEVLLTLAVICSLYIAWQLWWTGVESEHNQEQERTQVAWSNLSTGEKTAIAQEQQGDPPTSAQTSGDGDLVAVLYIPRFGLEWQRNIVQGTSLDQLARHGLGHYENTQMPGEVGNFAAAGHRAGYGQPLGDINKLQEGDPIIVRTQDYWYVYHYTSHKIVLPTQVGVIASNPENPGQQASKRMITLTTCEPRYETATHRWIAYGELSYWAKVSDGIPKELAQKDSSGDVKFVGADRTSIVSKLSSLTPVVLVALAVYLVLFLAAAVVWRWPKIAAYRAGTRTRPAWSIYGSLMNVQPGPLPLRIVLVAMLAIIVIASLFQWGFPWAAGNIPYLRLMSNYVTV